MSYINGTKGTACSRHTRLFGDPTPACGASPDTVQMSSTVAPTVSVDRGHTVVTACPFGGASPESWGPERGGGAQNREVGPDTACFQLSAPQHICHRLLSCSTISA
jgi:hypothetical protein